MREISPGLYAIEGPMPAVPQVMTRPAGLLESFPLPSNFLAKTGDQHWKNMRDTLRWVLAPGQYLGQWVGIHRDAIGAFMQGVATQAVEEIQREEHARSHAQSLEAQRLSRLLLAHSWHVAFACLTLGLYPLVRKLRGKPAFPFTSAMASINLDLIYGNRLRPPQLTPYTLRLELAARKERGGFRPDTTSVGMWGACVLLTMQQGLPRLVDHGLLRVEQDAAGADVFFPTPKLANMIAQAAESAN